MRSPRIKWSVKVKKRGGMWITEFKVGAQYFTIIECDPKHDDEHDKAKDRAEWFKKMFLKALSNLGVPIPDNEVRLCPDCFHLAHVGQCVVHGYLCRCKRRDGKGLDKREMAKLRKHVRHG